MTLWVSRAVFTLADVGAWRGSHVVVVAVGSPAFSLLHQWNHHLRINLTAHISVDVVSMLGCRPGLMLLAVTQPGN